MFWGLEDVIANFTNGWKGVATNKKVGGLFPNVNPGTALLKVSLSPDLVEDRGHTYGANLSEDDRRALIEYLKTL